MAATAEKGRSRGQGGTSLAMACPGNESSESAAGAAGATSSGGAETGRSGTSPGPPGAAPAWKTPSKVSVSLALQSARCEGSERSTRPCTAATAPPSGTVAGARSTAPLEARTVTVRLSPGASSGLPKGSKACSSGCGASCAPATAPAGIACTRSALAGPTGACRTAISPETRRVRLVREEGRDVSSQYGREGQGGGGGT